MRLKPKAWYLISALLFAAAIGMWHFGDRYAARHALILTKPKLAAKPAVIKTAAVAPVQPKHKSYRLRNTTQNIQQLMHNNHALILRNALIDTEVPVGLKIPDHLRAKKAPGSYMVQADRPLDKDFYAELSKVGASYVAYVPNDAALVKATPEQATNLSKMSDVIAVLPYEPYYKLDSTLLPTAVDQQPLTQTNLSVTTFPGQRDNALADLTQLGAHLIGEDRSPFGPVLVVSVPPQSLVAVAQMPLAQEIEVYSRRQIMNDLTRVQLGVSKDTLVGTPSYLNLSGAGVTINVNDTGVDTTHPDFGPSGRVFGDSLTDGDGHGTHVAGTIAGNGSQSSTVKGFVQGSVTNADFRGKATNASLYVQGLSLNYGPYISDASLQENASINLGPTNLISNNSWDYVSQVYDSHAASFDAATRDSQPNVTGDQPLLFVFAAGNNGNGDDNGVDGSEGTINSPGTAKNVITVGASDSPRYITNLVSYDDMSTNEVFLGGTDNSNLVASFSSCGNVDVGVEGIYGRFKPDLIAPGVFTISCRSSNYIDPTFETTLTVYSAPGQTVLANQTNVYPFYTSDSTSLLRFAVSSNVNSPNPFPILSILSDPFSPPTDIVSTNNYYDLTNFPPDEVVYFGVTPPTNQPGPVNYDVSFYLFETNYLGDYYTVLSNLNNNLKPYYRFETGTSMSAAAVSGLLGLMQEFLQKRTTFTNPSPALMKAMLINGCRSLGFQYDFNVNTSGANEQGWGIPNISNSIPASLTNSNPSILLVDQSTNGSLATGQYKTYTVNCLDPNVALAYPLRISLVWSDPPGNPAAGVALVNNLDLTVVDASGTNIYIGNNFAAGQIFTQNSTSTNLPSGQSDNSVQNIYVDQNGTAHFTVAGDSINNVQNVYINPANAPISFPLTITVSGTRVNVNAVTGQTNSIQQDYALVVSSDDPTLASPLTIGPNATQSKSPTLVTVASNGVPLLHQRVGANEPNLYNFAAGSTNGNVSQWHFFVFTNDQFSATNQATNVAFATFLPPNLAIPRESGSADIDLYVSTNSQLTNLVDSVIAAADKSLGRTGTESIIYTNSTPQLVYYIGVKSEDQQASDFGFYGVAQQAPFGTTSADGNTITANGTSLPVLIPNAVSIQPALVFAFLFNPNPLLQKIRRVTVTLGIQQGDSFDDFGTIQHNGVTIVLNHDSGSPGGFTNTYDDLQEDPNSGDITSDGPGNLTEYVDQIATGLWLLTEADNAIAQSGYVTTYSVSVDLQQPYSGFYATIPGNSFFDDYILIPNDATNLIIYATYESLGTNAAGSGPIGIYLTNAPGPILLTDYGSNNINPPGGSLTLGTNNPVPGFPGAPPLAGGTWYYGIYNQSTDPVTLYVQIVIQESLTPNLVQTYTNSGGPIPLTTDAHTDSQICISNGQQLVDLQVGVALSDTNLDDLVLHLTSPEGTSVLLFEDRGGTNATGLGQIVVSSNGVGTNMILTTNVVYTVFTEDTNLTETPIKFAPPPFAAQQITPPLVLFSNSFETVPAGVYTNYGSNAFTLTLEGWQVTNNVVSIMTTNGLGFLTNDEVGIVTDTNGEMIGTNGGTNILGTNYLALTSGRIIQTFGSTNGIPSTNGINITNGLPYQLLFYAKPSGILNWWKGDGNAYDSTFTNFANTNNLYTNTSYTNFGTISNVFFDIGEVNEAFHFTGMVTNIMVTNSPTNGSFGNEVDFGTNAGNFGTNDFSIDFWIRQPVGSTNAYACLEKMGTCDDLTNFFEIRIGSVNGNTNIGQLVFTIADNFGLSSNQLVSTNAINDGNFHHVALIREGTTNAFYIDGMENSITNTVGIANITNGAMFRIGQSSCVSPDTNSDGTQPFIGDLDELDLYSRALSPAEVFAIYHAGSLGKYSTNSLQPNFTVTIDGVVTNTIILPNTGDWQLFTNNFIATNGQITVEFSGNPLGVLLDDIQLVQLPATNYNNYYLPEEPLSTLFGQNPLGCWTLDIWDTRTDSPLTNNGTLLSWSLQLTTSSTNAVLYVLSNDVPKTNIVLNTNGIAYFAVDVPYYVTDATNILTGLTGGPFTLFFDQSALPTGGLPGDYLLAGNVFDSTNVLTTLGSLPPLLPGQRYFLGVLNDGPATSTFNIEVDFNGSTNLITPLTNAIPFSNSIGTNVSGLTGPQYYSFVVPTNAAFVTFQILNPTNGEVDLYAREGLPLPNPQSFDYDSRNEGTNDQFIVVTTNSAPIALPVASTNQVIPLQPTTWYLAAFNAFDSSNVSYTIVATVVTNGFVDIIPLTNAVPYTNTATPGFPTNLFYSFTVTNNPSAIQFTVTNLTNFGNVELLASLDSFPTPAESFAGSFNPGTNAQIIQVFPSTNLPSLNGTWYLAVPNTFSSNVAYSIEATTNIIVAPPLAELTWSGINGPTWDILHTTNWFVTTNFSPTNLTVYQNGSPVIFDDTASMFTVNFFQALLPASVTFSNDVNSYMLGGAGSISGAPLSVSGNGMVTLDNSGPNNFYSVDVEGTLQIGNNDANGSVGTSGINDNGNLIYDRTDNIAVPNSISGTGTLDQSGTGIITLSGFNTYQGNTLINAGTVLIDNTNTLGSGQYVIISSNAMFDMGGLTVSNGPSNQLFVGKVFELSGSGIGGLGAIVNDGPHPQLGGLDALLLGDNAAIGGTARWDVRPGNYGLVLLHSDTLTKTGTNRINFFSTGVTGDPTQGNILINQGTLSFEGPVSVQGFNAITIASNGLLGQVTNTLESITTPIVVVGGGITNLSGGGTTYLDSPIELSNSVTLGNGGGLDVFDGVISGAGGITNIGPGTNALSVTNTYVGLTLITPGSTLQLTNTGSIAASTNVTISTNAVLDTFGRTDRSLTLGSNQTIFVNGMLVGYRTFTHPGSIVSGNGRITNTSGLIIGPGAELAPGPSPGVIGDLFIAQAVTLQGETLMKISKGSSPSNDMVTTEVVSYGGSLVVTNIGSNAFAVGDSFTLFNSALSFGSFASMVLPPLPPGLTWANTFGTSGPGIISVVNNTTPVISNIALSMAGSNLILSGTNGAKNGQYIVLTTTNLALPLTNWTPIATDYFNSLGNFSVTNRATNGAQFFIIESP